MFTNFMVVVQDLSCELVDHQICIIYMSQTEVECTGSVAVPEVRLSNYSVHAV